VARVGSTHVYHTQLYCIKLHSVQRGVVSRRPLFLLAHVSFFCMQGQVRRVYCHTVNNQDLRSENRLKERLRVLASVPFQVESTLCVALLAKHTFV
jgi:hypothetical protein